MIDGMDEDVAYALANRAFDATQTETPEQINMDRVYLRLKVKSLENDNQVLWRWLQEVNKPGLRQRLWTWILEATTYPSRRA